MSRVDCRRVRGRPKAVRRHRPSLAHAIWQRQNTHDDDEERRQRLCLYYTGRAIAMAMAYRVHGMNVGRLLRPVPINLNAPVLQDMRIPRVSVFRDRMDNSTGRRLGLHQATEIIIVTAMMTGGDDVRPRGSRKCTSHSSTKCGSVPEDSTPGARDVAW